MYKLALPVFKSFIGLHGSQNRSVLCFIEVWNFYLLLLCTFSRQDTESQVGFFFTYQLYFPTQYFSSIYFLSHRDVLTIKVVCP